MYVQYFSSTITRITNVFLKIFVGETKPETKTKTRNESEIDIYGILVMVKISDAKFGTSLACILQVLSRPILNVSTVICFVRVSVVAILSASTIHSA